MRRRWREVGGEWEWNAAAAMSREIFKNYFCFEAIYLETQSMHTHKFSVVSIPRTRQEELDSVENRTGFREGWEFIFCSFEV